MFDFMVVFGRIVSTVVNGVDKIICANLSFDYGDEGEAVETSSGEALWFGAPGFYCRPRASVKGAQATALSPEGWTEVVCLRVGDNTVPIAARDLRCNAQVNPREAELGLAHWDGGFISLQSNDDDDGTKIVLYAPRQNGSGVVDKASCISMDSTSGNEHVSIMHESGASLTITKDKKIVLANAAGDAYVEVSDDGVTCNGNTVLSGAAVLGNKNPASCDFVMLATQLLVWVGEVNGALTAADTQLKALGTAGLTVPVAVPVAATMVKGI